MSSEKNYTNPEFTEAFQRVKEILIDLKKRIMPVKQGNAVNFRQNINDAIGTIPETDQETGAITKDGYGMSGAVFAMGEAVEKGLDNMDTALVQFTNDANDKFDTFTDEKNAALDNFKTEKNKALNDFNIDAEEALQKANNATTKADEAIANAETALGNANEAVTNANAAVTNANAAIESINQAIDQAEDVIQTAQQAADEAITAADQAIAATDAISGKVNNFLVVSQASENNKPMDSNGNEINQMPGGIWFKIISSSNSGENNTENGGIESTT